MKYSCNSEFLFMFCMWGDIYICLLKLILQNTSITSSCIRTLFCTQIFLYHTVFICVTIYICYDLLGLKENDGKLTRRILTLRAVMCIRGRMISSFVVCMNVMTNSSRPVFMSKHVSLWINYI